jgi:hypothetical protein
MQVVWQGAAAQSECKKRERGGIKTKQSYSIGTDAMLFSGFQH